MKLPHLVRLLCIVLFAAGLSASVIPASAQTITLRVGGAHPAWGIPDRNATSPMERARRVIFDVFSHKNPDIKLERYSSLSIQGPAAESGLLMAYAGGTAPDIVYVNFRQLRNYAAQGFLRPLDDLIAQNPDALKRVQPAVRGVLNVDGHIYSVPYAQYVQALYYRKDLFREAGLDPNRPPTNWDEFYQTAKALTKQDKSQFGFGFEQGEEAYYWINFLWQAGGEITQPNGTGRDLAAFNTPAGVAALQYYRKLLLEPWKDQNGKEWNGVANRSTTRKQDISSGKMGMWFAYQSDDIANMNQYDINPSLIGIAAMPKGPSGKSANEINAGMWAINSGVKNPQKIAACWRFIRFMASEEAATLRVKAFVENGLGQLVNPLELERCGYHEYITAAQKPWMQANRALFAAGKPEPSGPNMAFIYNLVNEPLDQSILYPDRPAQKILDDAVAKINAKLLNYTPPDEMRRRRTVAWSLFALLGSIGAFLLTKLLVEAIRAFRHNRSQTVAVGLPFRTHLAAWLFMAPAVGSVAVWAYLPLLRGMVMAFQNVQILGGSRFVGLDNFIEAAYQESFWRGIGNSFLFTAWLLALGFVAPILLALLLHEIPKGKVLFRILYYLPAVTTSVVVAMLFKQFYETNGLFNQILHYVGIGEQKWLQDPNQAMFAVVLPLVWAGAGPGSIIYLAALQSIPDEMYEAADLDGASPWTKVFRITLPTLQPLILINLVGATIAAFKIMEPVLVQTGGGPDNATHTIGLEVWYNAFMYLKLGYATAAAWMMGSLLIGLTIYQLRVLQQMRFASGGR